MFNFGEACAFLGPPHTALHSPLQATPSRTSQTPCPSQQAPEPTPRICVAFSYTGYSKSSVTDSTPKTTVGTPAYIAPEVFSGDKVRNESLRGNHPAVVVQGCSSMHARVQCADLHPACLGLPSCSATPTHIPVHASSTLQLHCPAVPRSRCPAVLQ